MPTTFLAVLLNSLLSALTNHSVWFAVTFWAYLQTRSVVVTSVMAGLYLTMVAGTGFFQGALVDRFPKKTVMIASTALSGILYVIATLIFLGSPASAFTSLTNPSLWAVIVLCLVGALVGNIRTIVLTTLVPVLISNEDDRPRANGLVGAANGVSFLVASIVSGAVVGFLGMQAMLQMAMVAMLLVIAHLIVLRIPNRPTHLSDEDHHPTSIDIPGTLKAVRSVPGLFALILFSTFNNFIGGIFMSLMDAYGLSLVSVQVWGLLWGFLSLGVIVGGLVVGRTGLGVNPVRTLLLCNVAMWAACAVFTVQSSIVLLAAGTLVFMTLMPVVEAAEQTIMQRVIPHERLGRVVGFAQSAEQAASPVTAFLIGPIAQFIFIPFMTTGRGPELLPWFGSGTERGIALLFTIAGVLGLAMTLAALRSKAYRDLSDHYRVSSIAIAQKQPAAVD